METTLRLSWSISRARDTYGYNVVTLTDEGTGKRYKASGGGYDMVGTVFGAWLADTQQDGLRRIADTFGPSSEHRGQIADHYGMYRWDAEGPVLDGACGTDSMTRIAREIGLKLERTYKRSTGETTGWIVTTSPEEAARKDGDPLAD